MMLKHASYVSKAGMWKRTNLSRYCVIFLINCCFFFDQNISENIFFVCDKSQMGAYHTLDLEQNRKFTIAKSEWDLICLDRIEMACDPTRHAEIAAVIMQDGLAQVCLITSTMTIVRAKIDHAIPRKRKGHSSQHEKVRWMKS